MDEDQPATIQLTSSQIPGEATESLKLKGPCQ